MSVALAATLSACTSDETNHAGSDRPPAAGTTTDAAPDAELVEAAGRVIRFLQGDLPFDAVRVADTVTLRLSPEGGGAQTSLPRESLRDPANWVVPTGHGHQSLVPPSGLPQVTARAGVHYNCLESTLNSVAPELADLPHVGVRLTPHRDTNCLQTWNLTLVFQATAGLPVLTAALYDQWEW